MIWRLRGPQAVFIDTSAFFATAVQRDKNHGAATTLLRNLSSAGSRVVTSNYVVAETHALILRRAGRERALQFLSGIDGGTTTVVRAGPADESLARGILLRYTDKDFSLTDAISFALMERLGIADAFSFDSDFAQYGFNTLTP